MVIPWFLIGEVPLYLVGPGVKAGVALAPRASSSSSVLLSSLALSETKVYELSILGRITKEDATHGRRLFGRHLPPTLTVRANSRSQDLGFALWHTAKTSVPQGKSEILRSTICSNCEGWWKAPSGPLCHGAQRCPGFSFFRMSVDDHLQQAASPVHISTYTSQ
jgi:hypothetical protein